MKKWRCTVCKYMHIGDTPPDSCPECGVGPELFELIEDSAAGGEKNDARMKNAAAVLEEEQVSQARPAVFKISYGLYVVTSCSGGRVNGQVCNTVFQITSDPLRIAASINHENLTHEFILDSGVFAVHILGIGHINTVRRFGFRSGRDFEKFEKVDYHIGKTGAPILPENMALGYLECRVLKNKTMDAGTHSLFLGEVIGGRLYDEDAEPMTYAYYRANK